MSQVLGALIFAPIMFIIFYVIGYFPLLLGIKMLVQQGSNLFHGFWGASAYTFDMNERIKTIKKVTKIADLILSLILAIACAACILR